MIVISGYSGTAVYQDYARSIAKLGYTAFLVQGRSIWIRESKSAENLQEVISVSQRDARVVPGKVAVIGFSVGGGGALLHATPLVDSVAAVIAYYPDATRLENIGRTAARVAVPTLTFAGEQDRYANCCLVESIREFDSAARTAKTPFELVTYPNAEHAFNLDGSSFQADTAADAWERARGFLGKYLSVK